MNNPQKDLGSYHLITKDQDRYVSKPVTALGRSERPTLTELTNSLPALGLPATDVDFALYWVSEEDTEAEYPVLAGSVPMLEKYSDYRIANNTSEPFVDYLNRYRSMLAAVEAEESVTVDTLMYMLNRVDLSPEDAQKLVTMPPVDDPVEYEQLVTRPGEVFMLVLYVEKHLSYHLVSRNPEILQLIDELRVVQSEGRFSNEWFDDWWDRNDTVQTKLVAQNSDKGIAGLVKDLAADETLNSLPVDYREAGISNLEGLAELRNTIGHSTIYNSMEVGGKRLIMPHFTKHTDRANRQTISTHFDDETYDLIKSMIEDAHEFLQICARIPPAEN